MHETEREQATITSIGVRRRRGKVKVRMDDSNEVQIARRGKLGPMPSYCAPCNYFPTSEDPYEESLNAGDCNSPRCEYSFSAGKCNQIFPSAKCTLIVDEIITALRQPNITIVGLYGSSYARKHQVVKIMTRRVERDGLFDEVVMASVTKKPDIKRIQGEFENKLGLCLQEKTLKGRATRLCESIKTKEKILIVLDDLWGGINFGEIGIPFGNDHKGCKILLVAENQQVLSDKMKTQKEYSLDVPVNVGLITRSLS